MPRSKGVVPGKERKKRTLKAAKGNFQGRRKLYRIAKETVLRGLQFAYRDRRTKKRMMRRLWIQRINAACRLQGISYNRFIDGLKRAQVEINRKALADLAVQDMAAFAKVVQIARANSPETNSAA